MSTNKNHHDGNPSYDTKPSLENESNLISYNSDTTNSYNIKHLFSSSSVKNTPFNTPPQSWLNHTPPENYCEYLSSGTAQKEKGTSVRSYSQQFLAPMTSAPPSYYNDSFLPSFVDENEDKASDQLKQLRDTINYKRALKSAQYYLKRKAQDKKAYYTINHEWVLEGLCVAIDLDIKSIKIKSEMGTGKSYAVRWLLKNHHAVKSVLLITALASLNRSAISSATEHGLDGIVYNDMHEGDNHEITSTTFNSADKVVQKRGSFKFDMILIDESEQCAVFMTSQNKSIKNLATASKTIKKICGKSGFVILADAHLSFNSHAFAERFCSDRDFCPMFNNYKKYTDITYSVLSNYEAGIAHIEKLLSEGKNVFCVFTSSELAHQTMRMLKDEGVTTSIKNIEVSKHTKLDDLTKETLAEPSKFKLYQLSIISPLAGAGISIEGTHYHETIAFVTRDFGRTPNSKSALQMLMRVRELIDKHITIVKIDSQFTDQTFDSFEEVDERTSLQLGFFFDVRKRVINGTATDSEQKNYKKSLKSQMLYDAQIQKNYISDYWKFWSNFFNELKSKGMKQVKSDKSTASFNTKEARKAAKANIANDKKIEFVDADYVDDETYKNLIITDKHQQEMLSIEQSQQLKKRIVIDKFIALGDEEMPTQDDSEYAYDLYIDGYSSALNNAHLSQLTTREAKKILNSDVNGIGAYLDGKLDDFNMSPAKRESELAIFKPIATIIGLQQNDNNEYYIEHELLDDALCKSRNGHRRQTAELKKAIKVYNAFHPDESNLSAKTLKKSPAAFVREILKNKLKIKYRKVRNEEAYILDDCPMVDLLNSTNSNIYNKKLQKIDEAVQRDKDRTLQADVELQINEFVESELQLPQDNKLHLIDNLMRIPSNMRAKIIDKYLSTAQETERQNPRHTQLAWAHIMLKIDADFYDK